VAAEQPCLIQFSSPQNLGQHVYQTKVQNVNDMRQHLIDVEWNRGLSVMALTRDADVSMHSSYMRTFWLFIEIHISQNVSQDICFRLSLVSWHLLSQCSVATRLRCGGIFSDYFITHLLLSQKLKKIENRLTG